MQPTPVQNPNPQNDRAQTRDAALTGLAVIGFVALVILGIALAIYSARFVPDVVSKIGTSTSLLGNDSSSTTPVLSVEPMTTIPFATSTDATTTAAVPDSAPVPAKPALYGFPDLTVRITAIGYLAGDTTDTFVATPVIPAGAHPAIKFVVTNIGTNTAGPWAFTANIPSVSGPYFNSPIEQPLNPGDHIDFTLGFNQTVPGNQIVSVLVDPMNVIPESNELNNSAAANVVVGY